MDLNKARQDLTEVCRLAYERGYICGTEGNFSIRLEADKILVTPRGVCKGRLRAEELVLINKKGEMIATSNNLPSQITGPSTEIAMHLAAYARRADIGAVAHAHPTTAVGFTVAGKSLKTSILPEVVCTLGTIPTAPYATPSTPEVVSSMEGLIERWDAVALDHHGVIVVGVDIWDAFYKLETLEHHAQTLLVAELLGGAQALSASQVKKLLSLRSRYGQTRALAEDVLLGSECSRQDQE